MQKILTEWRQYLTEQEQSVAGDPNAALTDKYWNKTDIPQDDFKQLYNIVHKGSYLGRKMRAGGQADRARPHTRATAAKILGMRAKALGNDAEARRYAEKERRLRGQKAAPGVGRSATVRAVDAFLGKEDPAVEKGLYSSKERPAFAKHIIDIATSVKSSTGIKILDPTMPVTEPPEWAKSNPGTYATFQTLADFLASDPFTAASWLLPAGSIGKAAQLRTVAKARSGLAAGLKRASNAAARGDAKATQQIIKKTVQDAKKVGKAAPKGAARRAAELTRAQKADALHAAEMRVAKAAHNVEMAKLAKTRVRTEKGIEHWNMKDWATAREAHVEIIQTAKEYAFHAKKLMKANPGSASAKATFDNTLKTVRSAQRSHDKLFKGKTLVQARDAYLARSGPKALAKQTARQDAELARLSKYHRGMPAEEIILDQAKHMRTPDFTIKGVRVADMPKSQRAGHFKMLDKIEQTVAKSKAFKAARASREAARDAKFAKMDAETAALRTKLAKDRTKLAKDTKAWNVKANAELDAQKAKVFKKFAAALKADPGNKVLQQYVKGMRGVLNAMPRHPML